MAEATATLIAAHVASDTTRRALEHAARLISLNGNEEMAEELRTLNDLGREHRKLSEPPAPDERLLAELERGAKFLTTYASGPDLVASHLPQQDLGATFEELDRAAKFFFENAAFPKVEVEA